MDLIDRDALQKEIYHAYEYEYPTANGAFDEFVNKILRNIINNAPTVDAEPVRHGKWINEPPYTADGKYLKGQECSICHSYFVSDGNKPYSNHPYCPNCGALIEEGE